jgi:ATP/maltotriose-dependent transcriptional regulator MalT
MPDGRYLLHQMLRYYGRERLSESPEEAARMYERHCSYYADYLNGLRDELMGGKQAASVKEIGIELENVRAAWNWAVEHKRLIEIKKMALSLDSYAQFQSGYLEWGDALEKAISSLQDHEEISERDLLLAELQVCLGWIYIRLGSFEQAETVFEGSRVIYSGQDAPPALGVGTDPLHGLAILALIRGDHERAVELGKRAQQASEAHDTPHNISFSYYVLASAALAQGRYDRASRYAQQACSTASDSGDGWFLAYCLNEWGNAERALGNYPEAKGHFQAGYAIREEFKDPEGMAVALNHLGQLAILQKDYEEAQRLYQRSLVIYQDINDKGGLAIALAGLGNTALALGNYPQAQQRFHTGIKIAADIQFLPVIFSLLIGIGELLVQSDREDGGLALLAFVRHEPSSPQEEKERAQGCIKQLQEKLPTDEYQTAIQRGEGNTLNSAIESALTDLSALAASAVEVSTDTTQEIAVGGGALVEPLTSRELDVLRLIAGGMTNQEIADELIISTGTVKWYASQIYAKLNVGSRTQAVARARELGLLS